MSAAAQEGIDRAPGETARKRSVWPYVITGAILLNLALMGVCGKVACDHFLKKVDSSIIYLEDNATGTRKPLSPGTDSMVYPRFSADGRKVYFIRRNPGVKDTAPAEVWQHDISEGSESLYASVTGISPTTFIHPLTGKVLCHSRGEDTSRLSWFSPKDGSRRDIPCDTAHKANPRLSPDGKWILYENRMLNDDLFLMPSDGGEVRRMTKASSFLYMPKEATWHRDSRKFAYISFLELIVMDIGGHVVSKVDLTGLTNHKGLLFYPRDGNIIYVVARESEGTNFSFNIYAADTLKGTFSRMKGNRSFWEMSYDISPDGAYLVYTGPKE